MHIKKGLAMHLHHEKLVEWCFDYDERAEYIRTQKPPEERETRLRLFKLFKGELSPELVEACRVYGEACRVYFEANRVYVEADRAYDEACWVYNEACQVYDEALQVYDKILNKNMPAIEALHAAECPNCPWDGHTIFPKNPRN